MSTNLFSEDAMTGLIKSLTTSIERREKELKKLCKKPKIYDIATEITEAMLGNLIYLCNFKKVVGNNGKSYPILDLFDPLEKNILDTFKKITGKEYKPETTRAMEYRQSVS